jgi:transaldolase
MKVKLFADGADKEVMLEMYKNPLISGLTTNPSLMKKAGVKDYKEFSKDILSLIKDKPISLEVFTDDLDEMIQQALEISSWGENVYVKIPITNTKGESTYDVIKSLAKKNVKVNVTAILTIEQVYHILPAISKCPAGYISIFAGRIADTGKNPVPMIKLTLEILKGFPNLEIIWASSRELYNVIQADKVGCHIITITKDIFNKIPMIKKDLNELSLDTVKTFYKDAVSSGFSI